MSNQLLLVLGAFALLATIQLSINSMVLQASVVSYDNEATFNAMSIGQAMIDEIRATGTLYDQAAKYGVVYDSTQLTSPSMLGPDSGETISLPDRYPYQSQVVYNDVDDYNGYSRIDSSTVLGKFTVTDTIYYVQDANQSIKSSTQTWYKKIVVTVKHPSLLYPVVLKSLVVYRKYLPPS
jgi:hypothetical protein